MKIVFCDNSLKELINFRGEIINHFRQNGNDVVLLAPDNLADKDKIRSLKLYSLHLQRSGMNPFKDLGYLINLYKIYVHEKPDIVFHYTIKPNIYGSIAAFFANIPSIAMITGLGYAFNHSGVKTRLARMMYKFAMKFPKKVIVLNESNKDILIKNNIVSIEKIILLKGGEGINLSCFK